MGQGRRDALPRAAGASLDGVNGIVDRLRAVVLVGITAEVVQRRQELLVEVEQRVVATKGYAARLARRGVEDG